MSPSAAIKAAPRPDFHTLEKTSAGSSNHWKMVKLGDVAKTSSGGTPNRGNASYYGGNISWVKSGELGDSTVYETAETITESGLKNSSAKLFPKGTLCIALYGATIGKLGVLGMDAATNQAVCGIFLPENIDTFFAYFFLESKRRDLVEMGKGGAQPNISQGIIRDLEIPLPPLAEQKKIVAEIEKQFSRLEEGVGALKRVQANLKRYRAAVLKAACEGKLVPTEAELAKAKKRKFETGEELLARILAERRKNWKGKGKYKEPVAPDTSKLPTLPEGWVYASVEQLGIVGEQAVLTGPFGTNLGREDFIDAGVPVLTISCLKDTGIHLDKAAFISEEKALELERYRLMPGDLLFSRMASVGRAGIIGEALRGSLFNYHIMRLRLEPTVLLAKYYLAYVRGSAQVESYLCEVNHGATRAGINTEQLLNMPVALPPLAEQSRIVAEVDRRLSVVEELEGVVSANLQRATRLCQSILQKALKGELP